MPEITRLSGQRDWIDVDFVERERTPEPAIGLGIQSTLAGLSLSNTTDLFASLDVERSRKAIHEWVQNADLQPEDRQNPNQVALDETVIRITDWQYWLYAAADPETTQLLHVQLFSTATTALTEMFLQQLQKNTMSELLCFSSMAPNISKLHSSESGSNFKSVATEIATLSRNCPRTHTPTLVGFELLQPRRTENSRHMAPGLRSMAQCC